MSALDELSAHAVQQVERVVDRVGALLEDDGQRAELCGSLVLDLLARGAIHAAMADGLDPDRFSGPEKRRVTVVLLDKLREALRPEGDGRREPLPLRRTGGSIDFHWQNGWATYTVGYSLYPDDGWRVAEVFLNVTPSEGMAEANARDAGILASFALQHGATLDQLVEAVTHEPDGSASSIVGIALNLVAAEIARLRDGDADPGDGVSPLAPNAGPGDGGAGATAAVPAREDA